MNLLDHLTKLHADYLESLQRPDLGNGVRAVVALDVATRNALPQLLAVAKAARDAVDFDARTDPGVIELERKRVAVCEEANNCPDCKHARAVQLPGGMCNKHYCEHSAASNSVDRQVKYIEAWRWKSVLRQALATLGEVKL